MNKLFLKMYFSLAILSFIVTTPYIWEDAVTSGNLTGFLMLVLLYISTIFNLLFLFLGEKFVGKSQ